MIHIHYQPNALEVSRMNHALQLKLTLFPKTPNRRRTQHDRYVIDIKINPFGHCSTELRGNLFNPRFQLRQRPA